MNTPIVIDACTLINLLRIDEDNNFLYKRLTSLDIHISETVYNEFKANLFKNAIDDADKERLSVIFSLPGFDHHKDDDIKKNLGKNWVDKIVSYVGHTKKANGELFSSLLALSLSRENDVKICFYTDDFPAKDEFKDFFYIQQIGSIEDSVDLLLMLYWTEDDFSMQMLKRNLYNLKSEYNKVVVNFVNKIIALKTKYGKKQLIRKKLDSIVNAFYSNNMNEFGKYVDDIRKTKDRDIKECLSAFPNLPKQPKIAQKVDYVLKELDKIDIFKLLYA